jgi:hypothetical protein
MADPVAYRVTAFDKDGELINELVVKAGVQSITRRTMMQEGAARVEVEPADADELPEEFELD